MIGNILERNYNDVDLVKYRKNFIFWITVWFWPLVSADVDIVVISTSKYFRATLKHFDLRLNWHKSACMGVNWDSEVRILLMAVANIFKPWIQFGCVTIVFVNRWHSS